jgi:F0F1-type ATP synthase membrane subunit b/b'
MPATTAADEELSCALERVIQMCNEQLLQAEKRRREAETLSDVYQARLESMEWEQALTIRVAAQRLRGG